MKIIDFRNQEQNNIFPGGESFDFLIVGGGTAGCIVASNLAQMNVSVLVIEAGCQPPIDTEVIYVLRT